MRISNKHFKRNICELFFIVYVNTDARCRYHNLCGVGSLLLTSEWEIQWSSIMVTVQGQIRDPKNLKDFGAPIHLWVKNANMEPHWVV